MNNNNHNKSRKTNDQFIDYKSSLTKEEIIKILFFCYEEKTNTVNVNTIQVLQFNELIALVCELLNSAAVFNNKSDVIRVIIRINISKNIFICGTGLLELINGENYGFIRSSAYCYQQSNDDVFIPSFIIKKYNLRYADEIKYLITTDSESIERRVAINDILQINNIDSKSTILKTRKLFNDLKPIYPNKKISLSQKQYSNNVTTRIIDMFVPIGFGQRMLIVSPPKSGKTTIFQYLASSIGQDPNIKIILLLIDERPEEVTDLLENIKNIYKSFYSDFNENSYRHAYISELCAEHAKRLCELGHQVFVFIDSLTRVARAYNCTSSTTNKVMSGGIDLMALQKAKKLFGIARNTNYGSIGILATCLLHTGSKMDEVIFEEFKGTSNSDLYLDRSIAEKGIFPAIDIIKSGTRKHELLLPERELKRINQLRSFLSKTKMNSINIIIDKIKSSSNNIEFLNTIELND